MDNFEKTTRSIFVGNIPYDATEEKLISLFNQAGPVVGFRLVYDRESGNPKGYGFCEYNSKAIAESAIRNLQNIEYGGRPLRIGPASGDTATPVVASLNSVALNPPQESCYGDRVDPKVAGKDISQAVASLPPDKLYEVMVQMKAFIQNHPAEARQLLLQEPQLTYALLQAQIAMKIIEPKVAIAIMSRSNDQIPLTGIEKHHSAPTMQQAPPPSLHPQQQQQQMFMHQGHHNLHPNMQTPQMSQMSSLPMTQMLPPQLQPPMSVKMPLPMPMQNHYNQFQTMPPNYNQPQMMAQPTMAMDIRPIDIKTESVQSKEAMEMMNYFDSHGEKNKAELIKQVLNLTDEQVAKLPDEQRRSIEVLKNQLRKN